jgi:hypothetical protein
MNRTSAQIEVPRSPLRLAFTHTLDGVLKLLVPVPTRAAYERLFNNRVTFVLVRQWRCGRVLPPQWALDLMADRLQAITDEVRGIRDRERTQKETGPTLRARPHWED